MGFPYNKRLHKAGVLDFSSFGVRHLGLSGAHGFWHFAPQPWALNLNNRQTDRQTDRQTGYNVDIGAAPEEIGASPVKRLSDDTQTTVGTGLQLWRKSHRMRWRPVNINSTHTPTLYTARDRLFSDRLRRPGA